MRLTGITPPRQRHRATLSNAKPNLLPVCTYPQAAYQQYKPLQAPPHISVGHDFIHQMVGLEQIIPHFCWQFNPSISRKTVKHPCAPKSIHNISYKNRNHLQPVGK
ncbi:MAG: hypothetical protein GY743_06895 [Planctomycetaceae bacterium]|nr:hypothetical protein [Planctomycetaceae bacterium]